MNHMFSSVVIFFSFIYRKIIEKLVFVIMHNKANVLHTEICVQLIITFDALINTIKESIKQFPF